jgi:hypothetical protein
MMSSSCRARWWLLACLGLAACGGAGRVEHGRHNATPIRGVPVEPTRPSQGLYAADEALRDALSGPWQYVGTGKWPGIRRMYACAFRNERVSVVNVYCGITERQAFRLDVYSPTRGRVRIYAEAKGLVSARRRPDYFTFMVESEPLPGPDARLPPFALGMSFDELRGYEERRYSAFLPTCYGGLELSHAKGGCLGALAGSAPAWADRHRAFLDAASEEWYRVVREASALATRYGREPD